MLAVEVLVGVGVCLVMIGGLSWGGGLVGGGLDFGGGLVGGGLDFGGGLVGGGLVGGVDLGVLFLFLSLFLSLFRSFVGEGIVCSPGFQGFHWCSLRS